MLFEASKPLAPSWLPTLNTSLIVISGICLVFGYFFIRRRQIERHRFSMLMATGFAGAFLVVYVTRALFFATKVFVGEGLIRTVYLIILGSHTVLATVIVPMVLITLYRALRKKYSQHRAIARFTLPVWLYVVVTGWIIYMMLFVLE